MAARRGARNREAILAAAHDAIAELGYHAATTAEICRRAGVSSGTFFHYFPAKQDVLVALLTVDPAVGAGAGAGTSLDALLDEVVADAQRPHMAAFVREVSTLASTPGVAEALAALDEHRHAQVRDAVAQARRSGQADAAADPDAQHLRLQWVIEGFESLVAGGADAAALAPHLRELARLALG